MPGGKLVCLQATAVGLAAFACKQNLPAGERGFAGRQTTFACKQDCFVWLPAGRSGFQQLLPAGILQAKQYCCVQTEAFFLGAFDVACKHLLTAQHSALRAKEPPRHMRKSSMLYGRLKLGS